jgi:DNA-binding SARP family transcriptional activator
MVTALELSLTGDVSVTRAPDGEHHVVTGPARVVLAALVIERSTGLSRDALAGIVWPDELPATWASALRTHVSRARTALTRAGGLSGEVVTRAGDGYQLALPPEVDLVVDVERARSLVEQAHRARPGDPAAAARLASTAAELVAQPFLRDHGGAWVEEVRDRLDGLVTDALVLRSDALAEAGDGRAAVAAAEAALQRAPQREAAHRALMASHVAAGDRAAALHAYQRLRRTLADAHGVDPSPETERVYLGLLGPASVRPATDDRPSVTGSGAVVLPFVGRRHELAELAAAWRQAAAGGRHVVVISGEAGIGKSRLAAEAGQMAAAEGGLVLFGRCDEEAIVPYQPITEVLDAVVAAMPDDERPPWGPDTADGLGALLPSLPAPAREATPDRSGLFAAVTDVLASLALDRPVLVVLDDLQWADGDTLLLVRHLLRRAGDAPILVVAVTRDHDLGPGHALGDVIHALDRDGWVRRLPLRGLVEDDVAVLLGHLRGDGDHGREARRLVAESAGNPFFVTELARAGAAGRPRESPGGGQGDVAAGASTRPIPAGVQDLVTARLGHLPDDAVGLVRAGAVAGARFDLAVAGTAAGLDDDALIDAADAALASGLVAEETADRYRFPHDVVRRAIEAQLSGVRRRALHRRTADAVEQHQGHDLDRYMAVLAHHASAGADPAGDRRAVHWSRRAAVDAAARRAPAEALRLRRQARGHIPPAELELCAEVTVEVGLAELDAGDPAAGATLADGAAAAQRLGRTDLLADAALALVDAAAGDRNRLAAGRALVDAALADLVPGRPVDDPADDATDARRDLWVATARLCVRRLRLGGELPAACTGDRLPPLVDALHDALCAAYAPSELDRRRGLAEELAVLAAATGDPRYAVVAAHHLAMVAVQSGDEPGLDKALAGLADAGGTNAAGRGRGGDVRSDPVAVALLAQRALADVVVEGRIVEVPAALARAVDASGAAGTGAVDHPGRRLVDPPERIVTRHGAVVDWLTGEAAPPLVAGRVADDQPSDGLHAVALRALAAVAAGDPVAVADARAELGPYAHRPCSVGYLSFAGAASFHLGRLAAVLEDWSDAERHLQAALRHHSSLRARGWVALTQRALADVLNARGRPSDRDWIDALRAEADHVTRNLGLRAT